MTQSEKQRTNELLVGAVIVVGVLVAVIGTLWLSEFRMRGETQVAEALFRGVGQVQLGDAVKYRGVNVGRIETMDVEPGGGAIRVGMRIDSALELPADPGVVLAMEGFFGDWQAEIVSMSRYPRYDFLEGPDPAVYPGFAIPDISRLTASADQIAENLNTISERFELAFTEETALNLKRAIDNFTGVTEDLSGIVSTSADRFDTVTGEVETAATELSGAARSARGAFDELNRMFGEGTVDSILTDSRAITSNLRAASEQVDGTMSSFLDAAVRADSAFARIDRLSARVEAGEGAIGRLLADPTVIVRLEDVLLRVDTLLVDFQENPGRYIKLSIF